MQTHPPTNPNPAPSNTEARAALLLQTLFDARFDLHAASANFTATEIADLALTPKFEQRLAALIKLYNTTLFFRAATSRTTSMTALESVLPEAKNAVEKRRTATALLRATAAPLIPPPRNSILTNPIPANPPLGGPPLRGGPGQSQPRDLTTAAASSRRADPSHPESPADPDVRAPRSPPAQPSAAHRRPTTNTPPTTSRRRHLPPDPTHEPAPTLTPDQVAAILIAAAKNPDTPQPDAGLSTLAAFAAEEALIDNTPLNPGEPQDPEDVQDTIARLANSSLQRAAGTTEARDPRPPTITENQATYTRLLHTPGTPGTLTHQLHLTLTRCQDPHALNCWLLASIAVNELSVPP